MYKGSSKSCARAPKWSVQKSKITLNNRKPPLLFKTVTLMKKTVFLEHYSRLLGWCLVVSKAGIAYCTTTETGLDSGTCGRKGQVVKNIPFSNSGQSRLAASSVHLRNSRKHHSNKSTTSVSSKIPRSPAGDCKIIE